MLKLFVILSVALETEITHTIRSLVQSHLGVFLAQFESLSGLFVQLIFLDSLTDTSRSVLLQTYRRLSTRLLPLVQIVVALKSEESRLQYVNALIESFLSYSRSFPLT